MVAPILLALVIVAVCLAAGALVLRALGATDLTWLAGAVGFAALTVAAGLLVRLPGRAATSAVILGVVIVAGLVALRIRPAPRGEQPGSVVAGLVVIVIVLAAGVVPFVLGGHDGVLGEGVYTNDHAAQLYWTDWLQHGLGPEPNAVAWGYPVGPQSLVATIAEATGSSLVDVFNGLLLAIPVLTALAALALLAGLGPLPRIATASLVGLPFLAASFYAQSAFKETAMALLVLAFAATLALATEPEMMGVPRLARRAAAGVATLLALAGVFAYSVPALLWFALTLACWLLLLALTRDRRIDWPAVADAVRRRRLALAVTAVLVIAAAALTLGRLSEFVERIGDVSASTGRLNSPVWPGEALGVWPQEDFRVVRGEVSGALVATAFGAIAVIAGTAMLLRRRRYAIPAALAATVGVYLGARLFAGIHVEAKALAVMSPLAVLAALGGLFAAKGAAARWLAALGVAFLIAATGSTLLALRATPVGFDDRGAELEELAERVEGKAVAFLGVDRFAGYWLRETLAASPGGYVPVEIRARPEKVWQQGLAMDLDTLSADRLDKFDFAITTTAAFQSSPPENMREVDRTPSYVLWKREARTPRTQVLDEGGSPGAVLEPGDSRLFSLACREGKLFPGDGTATVLPRPVVGGARPWSRPLPFEAPGSATQELELAPGRWQLSLQYHSQVDMTLTAAGLEAELPASLVGMYITHQGQSAFWPVGEIEVPAGGGAIEVTVSAHEPTGLERAVGATRRVWLGRIAATRLDPLETKPDVVPVGTACGRYVDRYDPR